MDVIEDLLKIRKFVTEAQESARKLEGQMDYLMEQLSQQWGCSSLEAAQEKLQKLLNEAETAKEVLEGKVTELKELYEKAVSDE